MQSSFFRKHDRNPLDHATPHRARSCFLRPEDRYYAV